MIGAPALRLLASHAGIWRRPGFTIGAWDSLGFAYSDEVQAFVSACYDHELVLPDFDWGEWKATDDAMALREPDAIRSGATSLQLAQLLTVAIRADRFVEGELAAWFEVGLIQAICDRAERLTRYHDMISEYQDDPHPRRSPR